MLSGNCSLALGDTLASTALTLNMPAAAALSVLSFRTAVPAQAVSSRAIVAMHRLFEVMISPLLTFACQGAGNLSFGLLSDPRTRSSYWLARRACRARG